MLHTQAFIQVVEAYRELVVSHGLTHATDYSKITGGQGAQNAVPAGFKFIDFTVDVFNVVNDTLSQSELAWYEKHVLGPNYEELMLKQSENFIEMQERLGKVFIARQLYPVHSYLITEKR